MMKRILLACGLMALVACNKPSEGDCKRAIANIRVLLGTDKLTTESDQSAGMVRSCRGSAKKESVKCAMEASTVEQLKRCGLLKGEEIDELMAPGLLPPPAVVPAPPAEPPAPGTAPDTTLVPGTAPATGAAPTP
jgi:hypothetical protein